MRCTTSVFQSENLFYVVPLQKFFRDIFIDMRSKNQIGGTRNTMPIFFDKAEMRSITIRAGSHMSSPNHQTILDGVLKQIRRMSSLRPSPRHDTRLQSYESCRRYTGLAVKYRKTRFGAQKAFVAFYS